MPNPGIIRHLINVLEGAGQRGDFLTIEELLMALSRKFPERDPEGMLVTIRAQLSRMPTQRGIPVLKRKDKETGRLGYAIGG